MSSSRPFSTIGAANTYDHPPSTNSTARDNSNTTGGVWGYMLRTGRVQRHSTSTLSSTHDQDMPTSGDSRQRMRSLLSMIQDEEAGSFPGTRSSDNATRRRTLSGSSTPRRQSRRTTGQWTAPDARPHRAGNIRMATELAAAGEQLAQASANHERLLAMPIYDSGATAESEHDIERSQDGQARRKRRKLQHNPSIDKTYPKPYGYNGQAVPTPLRMQLISCDGGQCIMPRHAYDTRAHEPENVLKKNKSVYCTRENKCNMLFAHEGEIPFNLSKLVIKAPRVGYTHPLQQGLVFTSMERSPVFERTISYKIRDIAAGPFASYVQSQYNSGGKGFEGSSTESTYSGHSEEVDAVNVLDGYDLHRYQQCEHGSDDDEDHEEEYAEEEQEDEPEEEDGSGTINASDEGSGWSDDENILIDDEGASVDADDRQEELSSVEAATLDPAQLTLDPRTVADSDVSSVTASISDLTDAEGGLTSAMLGGHTGFQDEEGLLEVLRQGHIARLDRTHRRRMRDQREHEQWAHLNTSRTPRSPSAPPAEGELFMPVTHFRLSAVPRPSDHRITSHSDRLRPPTRNPNLDARSIREAISRRRDFEAAIYGTRTAGDISNDRDLMSVASASTDSVTATHLYRDPNDDFDDWLASRRFGSSAKRRTVRGDGHSTTRVTSQLNKNGNKIEITFEPAISCRYLLLKLWQEEHVDPWENGNEARRARSSSMRGNLGQSGGRTDARSGGPVREEDNIDIERIEAWGTAGHMWAPSTDIL